MQFIVLNISAAFSLESPNDWNAEKIVCADQSETIRQMLAAIYQFWNDFSPHGRISQCIIHRKGIEICDISSYICTNGLIKISCEFEMAKAGIGS